MTWTPIAAQYFLPLFEISPEKISENPETDPGARARPRHPTGRVLGVGNRRDVNISLLNRHGMAYKQARQAEGRLGPRGTAWTVRWVDPRKYPEA